MAHGEGTIRRCSGPRYELDGDALAYELWMATDEVLLSRHLSGSLRRVSA